jgi:hypothetical protein
MLILAVLYRLLTQLGSLQCVRKSCGSLPERSESRVCAVFFHPLRDGPEPGVARVIVSTRSKPLFRTKLATLNRSLDRIELVRETDALPAAEIAP